MRDELNPYASPSVAGATGSSTRAPRRIWFTRVIDVGLMMNLALLPVLMILGSSSDGLRRGGWAGLASAIESVLMASVLYVAFGLAPVSLFALLYTAFVDRGTRWWRTKCATAAIMSLLGLLAFAGALWLFFVILPQFIENEAKALR
jgi:hypothetical protein